MSTPLLEVRDLTVHRGDLEVLKSLSFEVKEGEIFGLLGPNGSGKSTTFSVLMGLLPAVSGQFFFNGKEVEGGSKALLRSMGIVFQNPSLDQLMSARENLEMSAKLYRLPRQKRRDRIEELLRFSDLIDRADERVSNFSGGMKRRLELARSLIHDPKILVMDEPTTGLDEGAFQRTWRRLLRLRKERGLSILLSTHRPEEAAFCDRIGFISDGKLVVCDTPSSLQSQVSGDHLNINLKSPEQAATILKSELQLEPIITDGQIKLTADEGHTLIPRIVEVLPQGSITSINMTRPHLGDVFLHLTGEKLAEESV
jgi:ABC-2 type transport system ATP-binding protein